MVLRSGYTACVDDQIIAAHGPHELAEGRTRHVLQPPPAATLRAADRCRPGFEPAAVARLAGGGHLEYDASRYALGRLGQVDRQLGADVGPAPTTAGGSEKVVAEERREEVREAPQVERGRHEAAAPEAFEAVPVVELAALAAGEHLVRLYDLLEPLVGVGGLRYVRMELPSETSKCLLDG